MGAIAIITARGGSKRIPRKNIRSFCGEPIIAYSIRAAQEAQCFDEVMVSTEDEEIAEISKSYGAKVPFMRGEKNADDFASTVDVLEEVLNSYQALGREFDQVCCIYPTAPFVTGEKLKKAMLLLKQADSVMPVVKASFPPLRSLTVKDGFVVPMWEEYISCRSQDLPDMYFDCGQFYCFWTEKFGETKNLIMGRTLPIEMDETEVQDIDNERDWELAEMKYKFMKEKS